MDKVLVSSCLIGRKVRHNGVARLSGHPVLDRWQAEGRIVPFCPEVGAGLGTPRLPAEIRGDGGTAVLEGRAAVLDRSGADLTGYYILGARLALDVAVREGCRFAVLTERSPSCGSRLIYDGSFEGVKRPGSGVTTALLRAHGIAVFPESEIPQIDRFLLS